MVWSKWRQKSDSLPWFLLKMHCIYRNRSLWDYTDMWNKSLVQISFPFLVIVLILKHLQRNPFQETFSTMISFQTDIQQMGKITNHIPYLPELNFPFKNCILEQVDVFSVGVCQLSAKMYSRRAKRQPLIWRVLELHRPIYPRDNWFQSLDSDYNDDGHHKRLSKCHLSDIN